MKSFFSADKPCRCGYDGTGAHRCHAGRSLGPDRQCPEEGREFLVPTNGALAGAQLKFSVVVACYCDEHKAEAGFGLSDPSQEDPGV